MKNSITNAFLSAFLAVTSMAASAEPVDVNQAPLKGDGPHFWERNQVSCSFGESVGALHEGANRGTSTDPAFYYFDLDQNGGRELIWKGTRYPTVVFSVKVENTKNIYLTAVDTKTLSAARAIGDAGKANLIFSEGSSAFRADVNCEILKPGPRN